MNLDLIKYTLNNIAHRKARSWLTVISILIGIMAIFTLLSFGQGLQNYMDEIFEELGTDKLVIQPKGFTPPGTNPLVLTESDAEYISKIGGIAEAEPMMLAQVEVKRELDEKGKFVYMGGFDPEEEILMEMLTVEVTIGSELNTDDKYKVIAGYNYLLKDKVFDKPLKKGSKIYINDIEFEIKGFVDEIGNPADDQNLYLTVPAAEEVLEVEDEYQMIVARAEKGADVNAVAEKVEEKLRKRKDQKEGQETFTVATFEQMMETYSQIVTILNGVLLGIALISVLVAGVNIMNSMYTAVLERTKEVGIMKAIGAKRSSILSVFLMESASLGFVGGLIGIILGFGISKIGESIAIAYGLSMLKPVFPWWLILGCLAFATFVAAFAGLLPAIRGAKQKPVDALRYE